MEFRASPALAGPVAFVHTPGYERTGNWSVGCWVTTLGIYINTSGREGGREGVGGVHMYSTSIQISLYKTTKTNSSSSVVKGVLCHIKLMLSQHSYWSPRKSESPSLFGKRIM